jgi:cobyrinic acid a,c-diamide synthase
MMTNAPLNVSTGSRRCPALLISAMASGQGKTTVTAGLARLYARAGKKVRVFKTGPDYLDAMILQRASGNPVYQLDLWMGGEDHCRQLLWNASADADVILVEGVMGLFDGDRSSADVAQLFGLPILAVIKGASMAQTFGAVVHGLATYRSGLKFAGVLASHVGSERHRDMLAESLISSDGDGMPFLGVLPRDDRYALPRRHLGLTQAQEIADLDTRLDAIADALAETALVALPREIEFLPTADQPIAKPLLHGTSIAVARDAAFAFLYQANLDLLSALGATLKFFSPLQDNALPQCDAIYLPGGYPELHLPALATNSALMDSIRAHHTANKPIVAECGGMMYLCESLTTANGEQASMTGLLPANVVMQKRLSNLGMQEVTLPEGTLRGHTFHYSTQQSPLTPFATTQSARAGGRSEAVYRNGRLHASYLHMYFPSNPLATARLFSPLGMNL